MTIEEAIKHCEAKAREQKYYAKTEKNGLMMQSCLHCAEEHIQLAEWLKELVKLRKEHANKKWIPCIEKLPKEHDTIFAKFKGTDKWDKYMWEKESDNVNVTIEFEDGKRQTQTMHTCDGKWYKGQTTLSYIVVAWKPLPEVYLGDNKN